MKFSVTPEDFLKGGLPDVGWHPCVIKTWDESGISKSEKNPGSQYTKVTYEIVTGPSKGKFIYTNFSEVAPGMMVGLILAVQGKTEKDLDKKKNFEFEVNQAAMEGKRVDVHVIASSYNNKPKREPDAYRPYTGPKTELTAQAGV